VSFACLVVVVVPPKNFWTPLKWQEKESEQPQKL
jgi:hypothetical protein